MTPTPKYPAPSTRTFAGATTSNLGHPRLNMLPADIPDLTQPATSANGLQLCPRATYALLAALADHENDIYEAADFCSNDRFRYDETQLPKLVTTWLSDQGQLTQAQWAIEYLKVLDGLITRLVAGELPTPRCVAEQFALATAADMALDGLDDADPNMIRLPEGDTEGEVTALIDDLNAATPPHVFDSTAAEEWFTPTN